MIKSRSGSSAPAGYRFPREIIAVAVRWYLRYGRSNRDVRPDPDAYILTNVDIAMKALDRLAVVPGDGTAAP